MPTENFPAQAIEWAARKKPAAGGRACATLVQFLASADCVRARLRRDLAQEGLTELGFEVLLTMQRLGGGAVPPSLISATSGIFRGTLTDILARLESGGLIVRRRNGEDRRQLLAELTPRGRTLSTTATERYIATMRCVMAGIRTPALAGIDQMVRAIRLAADRG